MQKDGSRCVPGAGLKSYIVLEVGDVVTILLELAAQASGPLQQSGEPSDDLLVGRTTASTWPPAATATGSPSGSCCPMPTLCCGWVGGANPSWPASRSTSPSRSGWLRWRCCSRIPRRCGWSVVTHGGDVSQRLDTSRGRGDSSVSTKVFPLRVFKALWRRNGALAPAISD
jgi:hypothetical protein